MRLGPLFLLALSLVVLLKFLIPFAIYSVLSTPDSIRQKPYTHSHSAQAISIRFACIFTKEIIRMEYYTYTKHTYSLRHGRRYEESNDILHMYIFEMCLRARSSSLKMRIRLRAYSLNRYMAFSATSTSRARVKLSLSLSVPSISDRFKFRMLNISKIYAF